MKQIEEQERKFQQEQEEINRKLQEEERLKVKIILIKVELNYKFFYFIYLLVQKLEREKYLVLKYQRELLEQVSDLTSCDGDDDDYGGDDGYNGS